MNVVNTCNGLIPYSEEDYELKKNLKLGEVYTCTIKVARNIDFHRLYFAMIKTSWEYLPEWEQAKYRNNIDNFRRDLQICAGYYNSYYSATRNDWVEEPKSIAFDKLDEVGFRQVYMAVRNVLDVYLRQFITEKEFEENILRF